VRWELKQSFNSQWCQKCFGQKLLKSDNVFKVMIDKLCLEYSHYKLLESDNFSRSCSCSCCWGCFFETVCIQ